MTKSKHSRRMVPITRSQNAFAVGVRTGVLSARTAKSLSAESTAAEKIASRSWITNRYAWSYSRKFAELLYGPLRGRMIGHIDMQDSTGTNLHHDENVEYAKRRSDGNEEIASDDRLGAVADECRPMLITSRNATRLGTQVFPYGPRRHADSELNKQLVSNALLAPRWILPIHSANDFARFGGNDGRPRLPDFHL